MDYEWRSPIDPASFSPLEPVKVIEHWHAEYDRLSELVVTFHKGKGDLTAAQSNEWNAMRHERNIAAARAMAYVPYVLDIVKATSPPF